MPSVSAPRRPASAPSEGAAPTFDDFTRAEPDEGLLARLHPAAADWFQRTHRNFTEAQKLCIPAILAGKSVLLTSPTGSGKTLAGFLGIIDQLARALPLREGIHAIYVSPLRALTYDIQKNLERPLREMGLEGKIRLGLRTGDTPAKERALLKRKPPHILLTTPESLAIMLCQPSHHASLSVCRYVVIDELHALAENKRGEHLSVTLERLERLVCSAPPPVLPAPSMPVRPRPSGEPEVKDPVPDSDCRATVPVDSGDVAPGNRDGRPTVPDEVPLAPRIAAVRSEMADAAGLCRVGLSATISPLETMAAFLAGVGRPCVIAEARTQRQAIVEVFSPLRRDPYPPSGQSAGRVMRELASLVRARRSVLIFTNTRAGAELLGLNLKAALPKLAAQVEIHHSSLDRNVRLEVEDRLKNGELRAVVCSTSLEMGVDIGAIDLVVMVSAPKGISRTLQRIGRSGHAVDQTSHGILIATNINDLIECTVTAHLVRERRLDPVQMQENSADVLAQHLMGFAMGEPGLPVEKAFEIVRGAWPFRRLERSDFERVVEYLEGGGRSLARAYTDTFGKLRVIESRLFTVSPRVERDYLVNIGTIVTEGLVEVTLRRRRLGTVEERFIQGLKPGDVFVLAGRAVRLLEVGWKTVRVEDAKGERPNIPVWSGSRRPLATGLAREIARLRTQLDDRLAAGSAATDWLVENWELSASNAQAVIAHFELQRRHSLVPREGLMVVERYREPNTRPPLSHYFFHSLIGRGANDALSRIVAWRVAKLAGGNALVTVDDYGFLLTVQRFQEMTRERWRECFARDGAEDDLRTALADSQLVRSQFRAVAQTGLMVPRQLPGKDRAPRQLRFSADILFRVLAQHEPDHPLVAEAYRQATTLFLDSDGACRWLEEAAALRWEFVELPIVSPFGFGLYAGKLKESMMFEDPAEAIERLYQQFYGGESFGGSRAAAEPASI